MAYLSDKTNNSLLYLFVFFWITLYLENTLSCSIFQATILQNYLIVATWNHATNQSMVERKTQMDTEKKCQKDGDSIRVCFLLNFVTPQILREMIQSERGSSWVLLILFGFSFMTLHSGRGVSSSRVKRNV